MSEYLVQSMPKISFGHLLVTFCGEYQYNFTILYCEKSQHQPINPNNPQIQRLCSGHPNKSQVVDSQLLAIFTLDLCQRGVNRGRRNPSIQSKWMPLTQPE